MGKRYDVSGRARILSTETLNQELVICPSRDWSFLIARVHSNHAIQTYWQESQALMPPVQ